MQLTWVKTFSNKNIIKSNIKTNKSEILRNKEKQYIYKMNQQMSK